MTDNKQIAKGSHNIQQNGEWNFNNSPISLIISPNRLTPSDATTLLKLTLKLREGKDKISQALPAGFQQKLDFNEVIRLKGIYMDPINSEQMNVVERAITDMVDSQPLIRRLTELFVQVLVLDDENHIVPGNGDKQLESIQSKLYETITNDPSFPTLGITDEVTHLFVTGLVGYGIMTCKILLNPNESGA